MNIYKASALYLLMTATTVSALGGVAFSQSVVVRLLNGKSGKPLKSIRVYVVTTDSNARQSTLDLKSDREGTLRFEASTTKSFQIRPVGTVACSEQPIGAPVRDYLIEEVFRRGVVTENNCGHINLEPTRGQITYFARYATWLELFRL